MKTQRIETNPPPTRESEPAKQVSTPLADEVLASVVGGTADTVRVIKNRQQNAEYLGTLLG